MNKSYVILISLIAAFGGLLFGFDTAVISGVLPIIKEIFEFGSYMEGTIVSSLIFGCIIGVVFAGLISERLGRKKTLMISAMLFFVSGIGTAMANDLNIFIGFRFVGGLAVGVASMLSPMYISEIAPKNLRGRLVSMYQLTIVIGISLAFISNRLLVNVGENNWRWMLVVMSAPALLFFLSLFAAPESPRWLVQKHKEKIAGEILVKVNGEKSGKAELQNIQDSIDKTELISFTELFRGKKSKLIIIGICLAIFQQITGINAIMYYAPTIFTKIGMSVDAAIFQAVTIGMVNLIFTIIAIFLVDRIGRKPLLIYGLIGMTISLGLVSYGFFQKEPNSIFLLIFILTYIASFAISLGPVVWVVIAEIFPNKLRGIAMSVSIIVLWSACLLVTLFFPVLRDGVGGGATFLIFCIASILAIIFVTLVVPETKGKSLEEIEEQLFRDVK